MLHGGCVVYLLSRWDSMLHSCFYPPKCNNSLLNRPISFYISLPSSFWLCSQSHGHQPSLSGIDVSTPPISPTVTSDIRQGDSGVVRPRVLITSLCQNKPNMIDPEHQSKTSRMNTRSCLVLRSMQFNKFLIILLI